MTTAIRIFSNASTRLINCTLRLVRRWKTPRMNKYTMNPMRKTVFHGCARINLTCRQSTHPFICGAELRVHRAHPRLRSRPLENPDQAEPDQDEEYERGGGGHLPDGLIHGLFDCRIVMHQHPHIPKRLHYADGHWNLEVLWPLLL